MIMRNAEYDRFGPWILEITDLDPLPPLFTEHAAKVDKTLMSIKIPRPIERRTASPGMNLYDYVLNMYEDNFDIFRREDDSVIKDNFKYTDIFCIKHSVVLLNGTLTLFTKEYTYKFNYNTVSNDVIKRIVGIIRERYAKEKKNLNLSEAVPAENELNFYFTNLAENEKRENPENLLFAYQPRTRLTSIGTSGIKKFFNLIIKKQLFESIHFCDGRELQTTGKGRDFKYIAQTDYGKEDCYIPVEKIGRVEIIANKSNSSLMNCRIEAGDEIFTTLMTAANQTLSQYSKFN
ncbi:MAG TPA: hypothetical protein DCO79_06175 [Spirochaeta sp.]|nr:hypothetical protein [Spirochaeta sp.]